MAALQSLLNNLWVGVVFILMLSVLVAAHELGHYLFARLFGMGVEEFAIGFGKRPLTIWMRRFYKIPLRPDDQPMLGAEGHEGGLEGASQRDRVEFVNDPAGQYLRERTDFTVRPIPLGGFVRIKGMVPDSDGSETLIPGGFYSKPPWQRVLVLLAGPLFSVLAGIAILIPLYTLQGVQRLKQDPVISVLAKDSAGEKAGLKVNDRIVSINGEPTAKFIDVIRLVRTHPGRELTFVVQRDGKPVTLKITPKADPEPTPVLDDSLEPTDELKIQGKIGALSGITTVRLGPGEAVTEALTIPVKGVKGLVRIFTRPKEIKDNIGGPGTMVAATGEAVQNGFGQVLTLAALLSISVGLFNLLPAPPLDGGQIVIALVEMVRGGKRLSLRVQEAMSTAGFCFVLLLIGTALVVDFQRLVTDRKPSPAPVKSK